LAALTELPSGRAAPQWFCGPALGDELAGRRACNRFAPPGMGPDAWGRLEASARAHPIRFSLARYGCGLGRWFMSRSLFGLFARWQWTSYGPFSISRFQPSALQLSGFLFRRRRLTRVAPMAPSDRGPASGQIDGSLARTGPLAPASACWLCACGRCRHHRCWMAPRPAASSCRPSAAPGFRRGLLRPAVFVRMALLVLRFCRRTDREILDSLSVNGGGGGHNSMYLLHYVFIVLLQYAPPVLPIRLAPRSARRDCFHRNPGVDLAGRGGPFAMCSWANIRSGQAMGGAGSLRGAGASPTGPSRTICPDDVFSRVQMRAR